LMVSLVNQAQHGRRHRDRIALRHRIQASGFGWSHEATGLKVYDTGAISFGLGGGQKRFNLYLWSQSRLFPVPFRRVLQTPSSQFA
jgi:hypothetical protein